VGVEIRQITKKTTGALNGGWLLAPGRVGVSGCFVGPIDFERLPGMEAKNPNEIYRWHSRSPFLAQNGKNILNISLCN
jgi:hypothetical protein